jgi:hypothetical protein
MADSFINADTDGLKQTGGDSNILNIQTGGNNAITINALQNVTLDGTGAVTVPVGTLAERPSAPAAGMFRFNDDSDEFEGYDGSAWGAIGGGGGNITTFGLFENAKLISADYTITTNNNALSGGPIEIGTGVNVTVPSGSVWTVV